MRYLKCFKSHEYVENKFKKEKRKHINLKKETSIRKGNGDSFPVLFFIFSYHSDRPKPKQHSHFLLNSGTDYQPFYFRFHFSQFLTV